MTRGLHRVYNLDGGEVGFELGFSSKSNQPPVQYRVTACATGQAVSID